MNTYKGVAYLAAQHRKFPPSAMDVFRGVDRPALAFLWGTFGTRKKAVRRYLRENSQKDHALVIYLLNNVCVRKGNCASGELWKKGPGGLNASLLRTNSRIRRKVVRRIKRIARFIARYKHDSTRPILVVGLEDNYSTAAARAVIELARAHWPWEVARNPVGHNVSQGIAGADYIEVHHIQGSGGSSSDPRIVSLDGEDIEFPHRHPTIPKSVNLAEVGWWIRREEGSAAVILLWSALHQGITGDSSRSPGPKRRRPQVPRRDVAEMRKLLN